MPWTSTRYPPAMEHLPEAVREKAIEIANALLDDDMEEGKAIRIAIARARRWAACSKSADLRSEHARDR
jgi:uncharacterized protein YdaT